jgi:hypothetical protein
MKESKLILLCDHETGGHQKYPRRATICSFSDRFYGRTHIRNTPSGSSVHCPTQHRNRSGTRSKDRDSRGNCPRLAVARSPYRDSSPSRLSRIHAVKELNFDRINRINRMEKGCGIRNNPSAFGESFVFCTSSCSSCSSCLKIFLSWSSTAWMRMRSAGFQRGVFYCFV